MSTSSRPAEGIGSIASQGASWKPRTASVEPDGTDGDSSNTDFTDADDVHVRAHWALLLAGSAGWGNYRHQADVLHSYQVCLRPDTLTDTSHCVCGYGRLFQKRSPAAVCSPCP